MKWRPLADLLVHVQEGSPGTPARLSWASAFRAAPPNCVSVTRDVGRLQR